MKNEDLKDRLLQNKDVKALEDDDLVQVSGGKAIASDLRCPRCGQLKDNGICINLRCFNYGSYW